MLSNRIRIYPQIDYEAHCPVDGASLKELELCIPGMRALVRGACSVCNVVCYSDLPVGHALWNTATLDSSTGTTHCTRDQNWFSKQLRRIYFDQAREEVFPIIHRSSRTESIVILNCIDSLYSHCLLKLLNAQRHLNQPDGIGCCVLIPSELKHLVPDGVDEIWEFPVPLSACSRWYSSLDRWIKHQLDGRREAFLSRAFPHPEPGTYDLKLFTKDLPPVSLPTDGPVVIYSWREDRTWGTSLGDQKKNVRELCAGLRKVFRDLSFIIVGAGSKDDSLGPVIDLRESDLTPDTKRTWFAHLAVADCVVGVHGANMMMSSGLSKAVIDLLPRSRFFNSFQDLLISNDRMDPRDVLLRYRTLYGNEDLSDIQPATVVDLTVAVLAFGERSSFWFNLNETSKMEFRPSKSGLFERGLEHLNSPSKSI
jgi:hypothetical protein